MSSGFSEVQRGVLIAGRYSLDQKIGAGGFGTVWRATRLADGVGVALKFLGRAVDGEAIARFEREARALARLDHPNCITLIEFVPAARSGVSVPVIVTELLTGQTLQQWQSRRRSVEEIIDVARQIAAALEAAHRVGITHRDLKPANVFVCASAAGLRVKVLDFGIARLNGDHQGDITATGVVIGTPGFMSPEQLRGSRDIGPAIDLYCLGAIMYQLLEHRPVFVADTPLGVAMMHLLDPAPPVRRADVRPELRQLVARLLEKDPRARPGSAAEVSRILNHLGSNRPSAIVEVDEPRTVSPALIMMGAVLVGAAIIGAVSLLKDEPSEPVTVVRSTDVSIVKQPSRRPSAPPTLPDAGERTESSNAPRALRSPGCGQSQVGGSRETLHFDVGLRRRRVLAYLPTDYAPDVEYPLVVLLHEASQTPEGFMDEVRLEAHADAKRFVMIAPDGVSPLISNINRRAPWRDREIQDAWETALAVMDGLCIDPDRVYLLGHGRGGIAAETLGCSTARVAAVATSSYRFTPGKEMCTPTKDPIPYLALLPTKDPDARLDASSEYYQSLREHEAQLRTKNQCADERQLAFKRGESTCYTWDECEAPLVSCHVDGGRHWPEYIVPGEAAPGPGNFPYQDVVWEFFEAHSAGERTQ